MTLPKLPTSTNIKISEPSKLKKSSSDWLLLQESKSRFSSSSMSPSSSGASMENAFPKMSTESGLSHFSQEVSKIDLLPCQNKSIFYTLFILFIKKIYLFY